MSAFDRAADRTERAKPPDVRLIGAVVAAAIALLIAVVGLALVPGSGWVLGIAGLPGTTWLAWRLAPRAVRGGIADTARVALELGILSILLADALVVAVLLGWEAVGAAGSQPASVDLTAMVGAAIEVALAFVPIAVIGAFMLGLPAAIVVLPAAFAWTVAVRALSGRGRT
jgi:hypothetical protein